MIEWVRSLFGQTGSSSTAKERLRLVLMTDHLALAPELIDQMKRDLVDVISRYVEVDRERVEVNFEREDKALAMLANIPIKSVNRPTITESIPAPAGSVATPSDATPPTGAPPTRPRRRKKKSAPANPAAAL